MARDIENLRAGTYHVLEKFEIGDDRLPLLARRGGCAEGADGVVAQVRQVELFDQQPPPRPLLLARRGDFPITGLDQSQVFRDNGNPMPQVVMHRTGD